MAEATEWKEAIKELIFQLFSDSPENFVRIVFFLDEESKLFQGEEEYLAWKTLKYAVRSCEAFKMYEGRKQVTSTILRAGRTINTSQTVSVLDDALVLISKHGNLVAAALAVVYLTATAIKSLYKWYNGEISGKRCAKDIIDSLVH